jgi:heat shock protein HslJ
MLYSNKNSSKPSTFKMKLKLLAIALFPLMLAACQSGDIQKAGDVAMSVLHRQNADQTLASYQWSTRTGTAPKPLVLNFDDKGRLSIATSCNGMGSSWKVEHNQIVTGPLMGTLMACEPKAMQQESVAKDLFNDRKAPFILDLKDAQQPTLTIISAIGEKYIFTGKMTAETKYQSQAETIFLEISPETKPCSGVAPQTCLQVREVKYSESGIKTQVDKDWTLFYDQIEGFTHNPNERQIIRVKRYEIKHPAADQSKYAYIHDMTVERSMIK